MISEVAVARVDIASDDSIHREGGNAITEFDPELTVATDSFRASRLASTSSPRTDGGIDQHPLLQPDPLGQLAEARVLAQRLVAGIDLEIDQARGARLERSLQ